MSINSSASASSNLAYGGHNARSPCSSHDTGAEDNSSIARLATHGNQDSVDTLLGGGAVSSSNVDALGSGGSRLRAAREEDGELDIQEDHALAELSASSLACGDQSQGVWRQWNPVLGDVSRMWSPMGSIRDRASERNENIHTGRDITSRGDEGEGSSKMPDMRSANGAQNRTCDRNTVLGMQDISDLPEYETGSDMAAPSIRSNHGIPDGYVSSSDRQRGGGGSASAHVGRRLSSPVAVVDAHCPLDALDVSDEFDAFVEHDLPTCNCFGVRETGIVEMSPLAVGNDLVVELGSDSAWHAFVQDACRKQECEAVWLSHMCNEH
eukprot:6473908-Amphidinium_carterae.1